LFFGPGWVAGDCLWPVICVVEKLSGRAAIQRSRDLMAGLRSAGRALAIRHLALAVFAIGEAVKSIGFLLRTGPIKQANVVVTATWFPVFALLAGAPLFLYDRTAANENGPLLAVRPHARSANHRANVLRELHDLVGGWGCSAAAEDAQKTG
jgi:hypothetical protein